MSIILYSDGVLAGDHNCQASLQGTLTTVGSMKKIWISECNTVAVGFTGDDRSPERSMQIVTFLVAIIRKHYLETAGSLFRKSLTCPNLNALFDTDRNSIIVMTADSVYDLIDDQLVEVGSNQFVAHGSGLSRAIMAIRNGKSATEAIELALRAMSAAERTYDIYQQADLAPMITTIETLEKLAEVVKCSLSS